MAFRPPKFVVSTGSARRRSTPGRRSSATVRKRKGRKHATGSQAPIWIEARRNAGWSVDFVHDQLADGPRFGVFYVIDDVTKVSLRRRPQVLFVGAPTLEQRRVGFMGFDEIDEVVDSEVGEGQNAVIAEPVDPYDAVLCVHLVGDVVQPVFAFAEILGDAVDRCDARDLVDVHG